MRKKILFMFGLVMVAAILIWGVLDLASVNAAIVDHPLISEVYYDTAGSDTDEEWVEIYNPSSVQVDISGFKIGDEETMGEGEGMYQFPENTFIAGNKTLVIAKDAVGFYNLYGKYPDFELTSSDDGGSDFSDTKDLSKYTNWGSGTLSLTNSGDEVLLLDKDDNVVDVVVFEGGVYANVTAHTGAASGNTLSRLPIDNDTDDCSLDFIEEVSPHPGYDRIYESNDYFNGIGVQAIDLTATDDIYWKAETANDESGFMFYGPYTADQTEGNYQASFRLRVSDNTNVNNVVRIDARNQDGGGLWVNRDIKGTDFNSTDEWQNFGLWFTRTDEGSMEYRVWFYDEVDVDFDNVMIAAVDRLIYEAEDLRHNSGQSVLDETYSGGAAWQATTTNNINHMIFGPYADLSNGDYEVKMVAKVDDNSIGDNVALLDVNNIFGTDEYKYRNIKPIEFDNNDAWQDFGLYFSRQDGGLMEYRVFYEGNAFLTIDNIIISKRDRMRYESENIFITNGQLIGDATASQNQAVQALTNDNDAGWIVYGPYTKDQLAGNYQACFDLKVADNTPAGPVVRINAYNSGGSGLEVDRDILGTEFDDVNQWQEFCLPFTRTGDGTMEYRVWFYDAVDVAVDYVDVDTI